MVKKKKILITSHTANFSKFNQSLMQRLKKEGYEVHYASAGEEPVKGCDRHFTVPFERNPLKVNNIKAIFKLKKIIENNNYQIIHTHTPMGSVITRLAAKKSRKHGTRIIYTAHGFHFFKGAPIINWLVYYPIEKILAKYTDILITINKEDYSLANKKFKTQVRFIPGVGIEINKFNTKTELEKNNLRKSLGLNKDNFIIIYAAELSKRKNQIWLIKNISKFIKNNNDVHLLLPGMDRLNGQCQKLINKNNLGNNIHILGYRNDINELLEISNLAISTSKQEGLPINILEAMATKLPVVATDCRGNRDLVKNEINGYLFKLNDKDKFNKYINTIINKSNLRKTISKNNIRDSKKYNCKDINTIMVAIYNNELKSHKSSPPMENRRIPNKKVRRL